MKWYYFVPFAIFMAMGGFLFRGLVLDPSHIPSPLIDKEAPQFKLAQLDNNDVIFNSADMRGQVWILNIWASWCAACIDEHPLFVELAQRQLLPIVGLNYKDTQDAAAAWLQRYGNPYSIVAKDESGKVGIDWGVYGVPETFVIDKSGIIRYKHVGPVDRKTIEEVIVPTVEQLWGNST